MTTTLLPASILPGLLEVSLRNQLDVQALFEQVGIDADIVGRSDRFISLTQLDALLYAAFTESDDPLFGLHVGADNHYGNLDLLGNLMATANSLEQGIGMLFRYKDLVVPYLDFSLDLYGKSVQLSVISKDPTLRFTATRTHNEVVVATMLSIGRSLLGADMPLTGACFLHAEPCADELESYGAFFQCPLSFSAGQNAIRFSAELLGTALPRAYPKYNERLRKSADQVLAGLSRAGGVTGQVVKQLERLLGEYTVTMEAVADVLAMTPRTLQRRLQEEGARFAQLRDQVRHQHACKALRQPRCDMQSLATELGFSDTANFYHAFKRWQGCAPGQYRKEYQKDFHQEPGKPPVQGSHA
ncbi:AraC family transcriptional regulator [Alcanivorax sp.]|jgi:AraC-like DNA-binding protein|uniref:AraC family transcriptional regulator n=1 Tax=Alcanivorax sp. TaxID=1872427 RepID=UPI0032D9A7C5